MTAGSTAMDGGPLLDGGLPTDGLTDEWRQWSAVWDMEVLSFLTLARPDHG